MTMGLLFWFLMLIWLVFGIFWYRSPTALGAWGTHGNSLFLFVLIALLGWHVYGPALR